MEAAAPPERSLLTPLMLWFLVLCASGLFMLLEPAWLVFLGTLPWLVGSRRGIRSGVIVGVCCGLVMVAHACGYKFAGSAMVVANRPFEPQAFVVGLGPGLRVTLSDGRTFEVAGLTAQTDGSDTLTEVCPVTGHAYTAWCEAKQHQGNPAAYEAWWANLDRQWGIWRTDEGIPVQVTEQEQGRARFIVGRRHLYWCGNTFFPVWFPARLPRYGPVDFGTLLLSRTNAIRPDGSSADEVYQERLDDIDRRRPEGSRPLNRPPSLAAPSP